MSSIGSLLHSPEATKSPSVAPGRLSNIEEHGAQLLELRTEVGPVYVCPSRMQRIRLQWAFRHFRVLPAQVLSRREQRLIERLSHSAVVKPAFPVTSDAVFGVVEKMRPHSPAPANRAVTLKTEVATTQAFPAKSRISGLPAPAAVKPIKIREVPRGLSTWDPGFHQWGALGALATVCLAVILATGYGILPSLKLPPMSNLQTLSTPIDHAANAIKEADLHPATPIALLVAPVTAELPNVAIPKRRVAPPPEPVTDPRQATEASDGSTRAASVGHSPMPTPVPAFVPSPEVTPIAAAAPPVRRFVSELPPGHFAHPVVSDPNLAGELQMKALIAADGSVKEVTVLSGSPKLAEAGMRAVRQWHYNPYQVLGKPTEVETQIKMNFFGQDAVSIASVANGSGSQPQ
jgi:hypothetical protein